MSGRVKRLVNWLVGFSKTKINKWKKLSTDCTTASSKNMVKNKVDTYLRSAGYT